MSELTKQDMLNRAVRGLRSQNWVKCADFDENREETQCRYVHPKDSTMRCAWGWVDTKLTVNDNAVGSVYDLRDRGIGVAASFSNGDPWNDTLPFAYAMQLAHDRANDGDMEQRFRALAQRHSLVFPED